MLDLAASYAYCTNVAKTQARNFYFSFTLLPPEKRASMCAIYAFMRYCDDLSDEEAVIEQKREMFARWREVLDQALAGDYGDSPILPAFHDTVRKYNIPPRFFHELIEGTMMDLDRNRYESFADLEQYCYRVAGVVGFVCIHIWGFTGGDAIYPPAEACGLAFQLTNILRDVKEDAEMGRIYLPLEDLRRFNYAEEELLAGVYDERFTALMRFEADRAREEYRKAAALCDMLDKDGLATYIIMYRIYRGLLERIEANDYNVFAQRISLSTGRKVSIVAQAWLGSRFRCGDPLLRI